MATATRTAKERILAIVADQPDDSSYDEILQELAFERTIDRGLRDVEEGRTISSEEMLESLVESRSDDPLPR